LKESNSFLHTISPISLTRIRLKKYSELFDDVINCTYYSVGFTRAQRLPAAESRAGRLLLAMEAIVEIGSIIFLLQLDKLLCRLNLTTEQNKRKRLSSS